jgi:hypothetical protein
MRARCSGVRSPGPSLTGPAKVGDDRTRTVQVRFEQGHEPSS